MRLALGCSGGALLNLDGELIGLTTAQSALAGSEAPGGYAVPLDAPMKRIIDVLMRGDEVEYGFLGVKFEPDARPGRGVMIKGVAPGSPAERPACFAATSSRPSTALRFTTLTICICKSASVWPAVRRKSRRWAATTGRRPARRRLPSRTRRARRSRRTVRPPSAVCAWTTPASWRSGSAGRTCRRAWPSARSCRTARPTRPACRWITSSRSVNGKPVTTPAEFYEAMPKTGSVKLTIANLEDREDVVTLDLK